MARRQLQIAGTQKDKDQEVDALAGVYVEKLYTARDIARAARDVKVETLALMRKKKIKEHTYQDGEYQYTLTRVATEKLHVKRVELATGKGEEVTVDEDEEGLAEPFDDGEEEDEGDDEEGEEASGLSVVR